MPLERGWKECAGDGGQDSVCREGGLYNVCRWKGWTVSAGKDEWSLTWYRSSWTASFRAACKQSTGSSASRAFSRRFKMAASANDSDFTAAVSARCSSLRLSVVVLVGDEEH